MTTHLQGHHQHGRRLRRRMLRGDELPLLLLLQQWPGLQLLLLLLVLNAALVPL